MMSLWYNLSPLLIDFIQQRLIQRTARHPTHET
jgi:hypothetical protein